MFTIKVVCSLWGRSGFSESDGGFVDFGINLASGFTAVFGWVCCKPGLECGTGFLCWVAGFSFWSPGCVDLTMSEPWGTGFCWLIGRGMRCGPFDTPKTRWCRVGVTTAFWTLRDCCDTGTRFGPSLFNCIQKENQSRILIEFFYLFKRFNSYVFYYIKHVCHCLVVMCVSIYIM